MLSRGNRKSSIHGSELGIDRIGNRGSQSVCDGVLDKPNNGALEENFKGRSEIGPNVSPDLNVNIMAFYIDENIDCINSWCHITARILLGNERETQTDVDSLHPNLSVALGDENPFFGAEVVSVEVS